MKQNIYYSSLEQLTLQPNDPPPVCVRQPLISGPQSRLDAEICGACVCNTCVLSSKQKAVYLTQHPCPHWNSSAT